MYGPGALPESSDMRESAHPSNPVLAFLFANILLAYFWAKTVQQLTVHNSPEGAYESFGMKLCQ